MPKSRYKSCVAAFVVAVLMFAGCSTEQEQSAVPAVVTADPVGTVVAVTGGNVRGTARRAWFARVPWDSVRGSTGCRKTLAATTPT